jgi:putative hydrolase of the HAD superfamily
MSNADRGPKEDCIRFYPSTDTDAIPLKSLIFDLDNTLYPASSSLADEMHHRMSVYVAQYLDIPMDQASELRKLGYENHGTTLRWLQLEQGLTDAEDFLEFVHPAEIENYLSPDPRLAPFMRGLDIPKAILTNGPRVHARRILDFYGISDCFVYVSDLQANNYVGKPHKPAYENCLSGLGILASEALFIDDLPKYLETFREMGGNCILVDENNDKQHDSYPAVRNIYELTQFLKS